MATYRHDTGPAPTGRNGNGTHHHETEFSERPVTGLVQEAIEQGRRLMRAEL
jgi:hypothetical protein